MKVTKIIVAVSLCCLSAVALADGFGVAGGNGSAGSAQSVNQLLGRTSTMTASPAAAKSSQPSLSMSKIQAILKNTQQKKAAQAQPAVVTATNASHDTSLGDTGMSQQAFANMSRTLMALSPQQIKTLHAMFDNTQKAVATFPNGQPPKPTSSAVVVNLSPGAAPPIVRLRNGFVTSLVFLDSTGQPWPIQAYDIGDPNSFNVEWNQKGNTLLVQSNTTYKSGNLAIILKGQDTPVMVTLMPGQQAVDYRVDLRVPGFGPNASAQMSTLPDTANPQLLDFLNGVPPNSAKQVKIDGGPCEGWIVDGHLYLRTRLTVLSPSWLAAMNSPDGTHVYELTKAPVVLASFRGKVIQLTIEGL